MSDQTLAQRAGRSALWQIAGGGWQTLVRLGASIYLARALKPSDFGLFGMALLYQEIILYTLSIGFGSGLIVKKDLTQKDLSVSFWLACFTRTIIFWILFLSAPIAALFWKEPRVEPIIRLISFTLLIQVIGVVPGTLANKNLKFKKLNIIRAIAILLESTTAIILVAFFHLTYWALVIGMMINAVFYNLTLWISCGCWLPKLYFDNDSFRYLFRFGFNTWLFSLMNYLKQNVDYFLVGRLLGTYQLGLYEFAYRLPHLVFERISQPVGAVLFPAFSKIQDDNQKLFQAYVKSVQSVCLICFPILFFLIALADILVPFLWGKQWTPVILPLKVLCVSAMIMCTIQPVGHIFLCKSRPDLLPLFSFLSLLLTFILLYFLINFWGLTGSAIAMVVSSLFYYIMLYKAFSLINGSLFSFFKKIFPVLLLGILIFIGSTIIKVLLTGMNNIYILLVSFLCSIFILILYIFYFKRETLYELMTTLKDR